MSTATSTTATPASTRDDLVRVSGRGYTVIRNIFVQVRVGNKWTGSTLGRLVEARQPRALLAYLLLLMAWSALERREKPLEAGVWARALSPDPPATPWAPAAMTRVWADLQALRLIKKGRQARLLRVEPRREDGRKPYTRPRPDQSSDVKELYFILPDQFWTDGWHEKLSLPGLAVLIILLHGTSGRDDARLPYERVQGWYGISAKTLQNGLEELRRKGLLSERREWVPEPLSAIGRTQHAFYSLNSPFSRADRAALQAVAVKETKARVAKKAKAAVGRPKPGGK